MAEGPLGAQVEHIVDLRSGCDPLDGLDPKLDPSAMLQVELQRPGTIEVALVADGITFAR